MKLWSSLASHTLSGKEGLVLAMERFVLDQAQRVTHGAMNIINNQ
jgi:hypothetical protein